MTTTSTILIATDLTDASHAAVTFAAELGAAVGARLELVHVTDLKVQSSTALELLDPATEPYVARWRERLAERLEDATSKLETERRRCEELGAVCESRLLDGRVWEELVAHAAKVDAAFVVVGPHGPTPLEVAVGALRPRLLGTTADRLVRHAPCPVWIVPPHFTAPTTGLFSRWLLALDFDDTSTEALELATTLARKTKGALTISHVLASRYQLDDEDPPQNWQELLHKARREEAEEKLQALSGAISDLDVAVHVRPTEESTYRAIMKEAEDHETTVLVMGSHGRSGVGRLLLGSTAERCLRRAHLPTLIARQSAK